MRALVPLLVLPVLCSVAFCPLSYAQDALERLEKLIDEDPPEIAAPAPPDAAPPATVIENVIPTPGYLGVTIDNTRKFGRGVIVLAVRPDGPAAIAGLQEGDLIIRAAGVATPSVEDFGRVIGTMSAGQRMPIEIERGGRRFEFTATLEGRDAGVIAERPRSTFYSDEPDPPRDTFTMGRPILGLQIGSLRSRSYSLLGLSTDWGVIIEDVIAGSPADQSGVPRGAIIVGINGMRIDNVNDVMALMTRLPADRPVELTYVLGGRSYRQAIPLQVADRPSDDDAGKLVLPPPPVPEIASPAQPRKKPETSPKSPPPPDELTEESPTPAAPEGELRLPPTTTAKVPVDDARVKTLQSELEELRRRAATLEAALDEMLREGESD